MALARLSRLGETESHGKRWVAEHRLPLGEHIRSFTLFCPDVDFTKLIERVRLLIQGSYIAYEFHMDDFEKVPFVFADAQFEKGAATFHIDTFLPHNVRDARLQIYCVDSFRADNYITTIFPHKL